MRKTGRILALLILATTEICFLSTFLPAQWQIEIFDWIATALPHSYDYSRVTHPALEQEIDQTLSALPALKIALYCLVVVLLAVNTFAIMRLWRRWVSA